MDRIIAFDLLSKRRFVSIAPPGSKISEPYVWDKDVDPLTLYGENCILSRNGLVLVRSYASEACSGKHTLFAPNGIDVINEGLLIADTDNARIIYYELNGSVSILSGLNSPTKLFFLK